MGEHHHIYGGDINMSNVELRQVVGNTTDSTGKLLRYAWNMDLLLLDGRQIATINRVPGAAIGLIPGVQLTTSQRTAVENAVAAARGGVKPASIGGPAQVLMDAVLLDDEDEDDGDDEGDDVEEKYV